MRRYFSGYMVLLVLAYAQTAFGFGADAPLPDPGQEARARALFAEIRCLVCQNQSIEDSGADLAVDLRAIVREQVSAGASNADVLQFMVDRYGDWVLLEPKLTSTTIALWVLPGIIGVVALLAAFLVWRHRNMEEPPADTAPLDSLSPEDTRRLSNLLAAQKDQS